MQMISASRPPLASMPSSGVRRGVAYLRGTSSSRTFPQLRALAACVSLLPAVSSRRRLVMTTALGVPEGAWRDDGSNSIEDLGSSFRVRPVRHVSASVRPPRGPVNALFAVPLESASYFEVTCKEFSGAPFVGIATEAGLAPGYKCKGLFYGGPGNLSDGSAALRTNFGDEVHQGDVIGVLIQRDGARLRMILYHNARCLGTAFETSTESTIYPVVQAKDEGDLFSIDFKEAPTSQTRQIADGKSGQWKLEQVLYPELLEVPLKIRCLLTVREEKEIGLVLKVVNLLRFQGSEETERLTIEGYSSTMMAGPEDLMALNLAVSEIHGEIPPLR